MIESCDDLMLEVERPCTESAQPQRQLGFTVDPQFGQYGPMLAINSSFLTEDELPWSSKDQECNSAGQIRMKVDCEAVS